MGKKKFHSRIAEANTVNEMVFSSRNHNNGNTAYNFSGGTKSQSNTVQPFKTITQVSASDRKIVKLSQVICKSRVSFR